MMKTKKIILTIFILSMIALIFSCCDEGGSVTPSISDNEETSDYFQLDVPYIEQNSDNTCLPASAAMILKYYENSRDIAEIRDKLALPWQEDGTGGIMYSGHGDVDKLFDYVKSLGFNAKKEWDGLTIEEIKDKLEAGFPIIILQDYNLDAYVEDDGHFSVIVGYREIGESDEENKLIINDPWPSRGQYWEVTYSDFKIRNSNWWKEQHNRDSDLSHSYIIWKDMSGIYTITASAGPHGSISPSGNINVNQGSDKSFTITPDSGYSIDDVLVDGSSVGTVSSYTFINVTEDHSISATFISTTPGLVHNLTKDTYYDTIQAALDDADNDNIIEVADGTYDESITFPSGKKITLKSVNGNSSTIIRGNDGSNTVTLNNSPEGTTLEGFTITHANGNYGSGIYANGNLTIKNCTISNNTTYSQGGGIHNGYSGTLTITGSTISNNTAFGFGGGISNHNGNGTLTITGSTISDNTANRGWGGGIHNSLDGTLTITASTISDNTAAESGGGICNDFDSTLTITASTISDNTANNDGGGIYNGNSTLTITASTISNNHSNNDGGGIYNSFDGTLTITGSTISDNTSNLCGGIYNDFDGTLTITGSTISNNAAYSQGGGIYICSCSVAIIIGGENTADKNTICGNYKTGEDPSPDQQIRNNFESLYDTYKDTNYISAYCD